MWVHFFCPTVVWLTISQILTLKGKSYTIPNVSITTTGGPWVAFSESYYKVSQLLTPDFINTHKSINFILDLKKYFRIYIYIFFFLYSWQNFLNGENTRRFNLHVQVDVTCRLMPSTYHWKWSESPVSWSLPFKISSISTFNTDQRQCFYHDRIVSLHTATSQASTV
jgi:hypothetical protein